jgi:hypothetical protein
MVSSGMLRRVALVSSSETSVLTRATRRNIPENAILHSNLRENLKSSTRLLLHLQRDADVICDLKESLIDY